MKIIFKWILICTLVWIIITTIMMFGLFYSVTDREALNSLGKLYLVLTFVCGPICGLAIGITEYAASKK